MRFSLITSTPTEMYAFNPFVNTPAVAPLTMEAFVAPANFDPDAQELNIVKAFAVYPDANKKYIFSVGTSATTVLPAVTGRSYAYAENGGAYTTIASGTVTWTVGSTKRNVVVIDSATNIEIDIFENINWLYLANCIVTRIFVRGHLKWIHTDSSVIFNTNFQSSFYQQSSLIGNLGINVNNISDYSFSQCYGITSAKIRALQLIDKSFHQLTNLANLELDVIVIGSGTNAVFYQCTSLLTVIISARCGTITESAFHSCTALTTINCHAIAPPTGLGSSTFYGVNKTTCILHVPVGSIAAYQAAAYWNQFTNIIADL